MFLYVFYENSELNETVSFFQIYLLQANTLYYTWVYIKKDELHIVAILFRSNTAPVHSQNIYLEYIYRK